MNHCYIFSQMKILVVNMCGFHGICINSSKSAALEEIGELVMFVCKTINIVDSNTTEVGTEIKHVLIGYIAREKAATLAALMDKYCQNSKVKLIVTLYDVVDIMTGIIHMSC